MGEGLNMFKMLQNAPKMRFKAQKGSEKAMNGVKIVRYPSSGPLKNKNKIGFVSSLFYFFGV
jgi:hypothetical protein